MEVFKNYLLLKGIVTKKTKYYLNWVEKLYSFYRIENGSDINSDKINKYLKHIAKINEDWKVQQASEAINLYFFYIRQKAEKEKTIDAKPNDQWKVRAEEMVNRLI